MNRFLLPFALLTCSAALGQWSGSARLDRIVADALAEGATPGAVLMVGRGDQVLHHRAYGSRSIEPEQTPMQLDTVFDCASLTKVTATTPAVMMLIEEGRLRLDDRVSDLLPGFAAKELKVRQLLTHYSGLRPDVDLEPAWSGYETGIRKALREKPVVAPDSRFLYSDINFILLAEIVHRISGKPINEFAAERIFEPLRMSDTGYRPGADLAERIAPTERLPSGELLAGVVHDPTTRYMGGVAGHAGMFSTAADLGRFCRMMLRGGELGGRRVLSPLSIAQMTTPQSPPGLPARGLGWDLESPYASVRGDLLPKGSYGHTGFTGTSMWLDPFTRMWIVLMTNRVHPTTRTSVVQLRARIASAAAAALEDVEVDAARLAARSKVAPIGDAGRMPNVVDPEPTRPKLSNVRVLTGLDVMARDEFRDWDGKRIGLITNHTGIDRDRRRNIDRIASAPNVELAAIFSPEHGIAGALDQESVGDATDPTTGVPVYSLYQPGRRRPSPEILAGLDALVFDIQDIGARFYTYATTMAYALEEAARAGLEFYVLDRPNPINGIDVGGPMLDPEHRSFVGYLDLPVRHGMTLGELAQMHNAEKSLGAKLRVVRMEGWRREMWFDQTGLPWVNPSPNMRTLNQAILYPGIALLEGLKNYSVGRGTDTPFEFIGAAWMDGPATAARLNARGLAGVRFYAVERTPTASHFAGQRIGGVQISIHDRNQIEPLKIGLEVAAALTQMHPGRLQLADTARLVGDAQTLHDWETETPPEQTLERWEAESSRFRNRRRAYLLYDRAPSP